MFSSKMNRKITAPVLIVLLSFSAWIPSYAEEEKLRRKQIEVLETIRLMQEKEMSSEEFDLTGIETIKPKYRSAKEALDMVNRIFTQLRLPKCIMFHDKRLNTIFIKGSKEQIEFVKSMVSEFYVLPQQLQINVKLIRASKKGKGISPEIKGLVSKLESLFAYPNYELLEAFSFITESEAETSQDSGGNYRISCTPRYIDEGKGIIRLEDFRLYDVSKDSVKTGGRGPKVSARAPVITRDDLSLYSETKFLENQLLFLTNRDFRKSILTTSLNIKNGDTVIIGSSRINGGDGSQALITAVTAKTIK